MVALPYRHREPTCAIGTLSARWRALLTLFAMAAFAC